MLLPKGLALAAAALVLLGAAPPAEQRYTVLMSGTAKGSLRVNETAKGERRSVLSFRDRGRGPDLETVVRVDARGLPVHVAISGTDYRRIATAENFTIAGSRATWTSAVDEGSAAAGGYYVANEGDAEATAALARALLAVPGRKLKLLPAGEASIRTLATRPIAGGGMATLYAIDGLGMTPSGVWLDDNRQLFASGSNWIGVIREGHEAEQTALLAAQADAFEGAARDTAKRLARRPAAGVLIRGARLFDAETRTLRPGTSVLVRGDTIAAVGPDGSIAVPRGVEVIDARGRVVMPGMWDMHVHVLGYEEGVMALAAGITTARDLGNDPVPLKRLTDQFDSGVLLGPRVLKAGLIDGRGPFAGPTKSLVTTPAEAEAAVDSFAALGYSMVKLYSSISTDAARAAIARAHARGMRVGGHLPSGLTAGDAVALGYDEIQHGNMWLLSFLGPEVLARSQTPSRFIDAYTRGHEIDPDGPAARAFVAQLKASGTVVDPTLVTFENMFTGWKGEMARATSPWAPRMPATSLRGARSGGRAKTPEERETYRASFARMQQLLKRLHDAGVPVVNGTDGGATLYARELELHVAAGLSPADVLYNATLGAARVMKLDATTGSVARGKRADLVLLDGDPLARIGAVRCAALVIKQGTLFDGDALAVAAGLAPRRGRCA
ncbi:amidohydrolase family protein [Sphingomonas koreensis]